MEEIASLARSSHLPPVEIVNDKSSFKALQVKHWVDRILSLIDSILIRFSSIEPEFLQNKSEEVATLLILCGENNEVSEWNNPTALRVFAMTSDTHSHDHHLDHH